MGYEQLYLKFFGGAVPHSPSLSIRPWSCPKPLAIIGVNPGDRDPPDFGLVGRRQVSKYYHSQFCTESMLGSGPFPEKEQNLPRM